MKRVCFTVFILAWPYLYHIERVGRLKAGIIDSPEAIGFSAIVNLILMAVFASCILYIKED